MATAAQLLASACTSGIQCLDKRQLLVVLAQATAGSMATANSLLAAACANGIACLDERQLLVVLAQAANAGGGGGGGAALTVTEQDGSPNVANVTTIKVTNATLTDNGGGVVSVVTGAGTAPVNFNLQGLVDPSANPSDTLEAWTWTNTVSGTFWIWNVGTQLWQQLV